MSFVFLLCYRKVSVASLIKMPMMKIIVMPPRWKMHVNHARDIYVYILIDRGIRIIIQTIRIRVLIY